MSCHLRDRRGRFVGPLRSKAHAAERVDVLALGAEVPPDDAGRVVRAKQGIRRRRWHEQLVSVVERDVGLQPIRASSHRREAKHRSWGTVLDFDVQLARRFDARRPLHQQRVDEGASRIERHHQRGRPLQRGQPTERAAVIQASEAIARDEEAVGQDQQRLGQRHSLVTTGERAVDVVRAGRLVAADRDAELPRRTVVESKRQQRGYRLDASRLPVPVLPSARVQ